MNDYAINLVRNGKMDATKLSQFELMEVLEEHLKDPTAFDRHQEILGDHLYSPEFTQAILGVLLDSHNEVSEYLAMKRLRQVIRSRCAEYRDHYLMQEVEDVLDDAGSDLIESMGYEKFNALRAGA